MQAGALKQTTFVKGGKLTRDQARDCVRVIDDRECVKAKLKAREEGDSHVQVTGVLVVPFRG